MTEAILLLVPLITAATYGERISPFLVTMLFVAVAVIIVRKGYDYVVTSGSFKKRV